MSDRLISSQNLPILENGDRVSRDEFERRYHRMPYQNIRLLLNSCVTLNYRAGESYRKADGAVEPPAVRSISFCDRASQFLKRVISVSAWTLKETLSNIEKSVVSYRLHHS